MFKYLFRECVWTSECSNTKRGWLIAWVFVFELATRHLHAFFLWECVFGKSIFLCMLDLYVCESLHYGVRGERFIQDVQSLFCVLFTHTHTHILLTNIVTHTPNIVITSPQNKLSLAQAHNRTLSHTHMWMYTVYMCAHALIVQLHQGTHAPLILESGRNIKIPLWNAELVKNSFFLNYTWRVLSTS